jgi:hypothetical protein
MGIPLNTPKTHTLCVVGAPPEAAARIAALLDEQRTRLESRWRPAPHGVADLLLIDAESVYGHMDWLKAQASGRVVVALASAPESGHSDYWLRMPVNATDLVALLNRIDARLGGKPTASVTPIRALPDKPAAAAVTAIPAAVAVASPAVRRATAAAVAVPPAAVLAPVAAAATPAPAPVATFQLLDLLKPDSPRAGRLHLQADGLPDIWLDPTAQTWHSTASLKGLSGWCTRNLAASEVKMAADAPFAAATSTLAAHPFARLQWLSHLVRGDGSFDAGLAPNGRYKLSRWPQSEREFPKHFRIATMMLKSAASIEEIAELSGANAADVTNFINAYHSLGFIEQEPAERAQEDTRRGGLFGRAKKTSVAS